MREEKERALQKDLRSQVLHLGRLLDLLQDRMGRLKTKLEADRYCEGLRDVLATLRDQVAVQPPEVTQHQIDLFKVHISGRLSFLEDPMRRDQEAVGMLDGMVGKVKIRQPAST